MLNREGANPVIRTVTRASTALLVAVAVLAGAAAVTVANGDVFSDVPDTHEYAAEINAAHAAGLVNGVGGGRYVPDRILTGRQAFKLATRLLEQFTDETGQLEVTRGEAAALLIRGLCGFSPDTPGCTN